MRCLPSIQLNLFSRFDYRFDWRWWSRVMLWKNYLHYDGWIVTLKQEFDKWVRTQHWSFVIERRTIFHLCKTFQIVCNCNQGVTGSFRQQLLMMTSSAKRRTRAWSREETIITARGASLYLSISSYAQKNRNCNHSERSGSNLYIDYRVCACLCCVNAVFIQSYLRVWGQEAIPEDGHYRFKTISASAK